MEKKVQRPETYDAMFEEGGSNGVFDLPYRRSPYYPMFKAVRESLRRHNVKNVLEVGCGTGGMAHMLFQTTELQYRGFDFSSVAIGKARERTGRANVFFHGDATVAHTYEGIGYEAIVCTEVLEHIEDDRLAISLWKPGVLCICSVPNYDADTHVRHFRSVDEVRERYGKLVDIERIETRCKPFLNDLSLANWLQAVKWNRYRLDRMKWLFGMSDFERNGGWFIFTGRRNAS